MEIEMRPSGSWRVRIYDKSTKKRKSFTAKTLTEAKRMAREYEAHIGEVPQDTVRTAIEKYISGRTNILKTRTIVTYRSYQAQYYEALNDREVWQITDAELQEAVNKWAEKLSAKYVKNIYGLLRSSIKYVMPNKPMNVKLPKRKAAKLNLPSEADVKKLLEVCEGTPLCTAIYLACFGALRRGEVSALNIEDIDFKGKKIRIDKNLVKTSSGEWIIEAPKNGESATISPPDIVFEKIKKYGLCRLNPDMITKNFDKLLSKNEIGHFTFHGLRHFCAARMLSLGLPIAYVQQYGRWKDQEVLMKIYNYLIDEVGREAMEKWNTYSQSL